MTSVNKIICIFLVFVALSGCAVTNTFVSYQARAVKYKSAIDVGDETKILAVLNESRGASDKQLYIAERGRMTHLAGMTDESIFDFEGVIEAIKIQDERAKVSIGGLGAKASSAVANDSVIPYSLASYEKIMVHHYQALNYIAKGDVNSASVEIRRANFLQSEALEDHTRELAKVEAAAQKDQVRLEELGLDEQLGSMSKVIGQVKNSFQNAYTFYLSGLVFEALGSDNDAYIDYKKSLEINPNNIYIQNDVLRLAKTLSMTEDLKRYKAQFKREPEVAKKGVGSIVVFYEDGYVPGKVERRLDFPNFASGGIVSVAMPVYDFVWHSPMPVAVSIDGVLAGNTQPVVDMSVLAAKSLREELPGMAVRQIVRAVTKSAVQKRAQKENPAAGFAMTLLNMATERADLRAWSTLPNNVQILRAQVVAGTHSATIVRGRFSERIDLDVKPGKTALVYITNTGVRNISRTYYL